MQVSSGGTQVSSQLFSEDSLFRNQDQIVNQANAFFYGFFRAAGASAHPIIGLRNPAASGVVIMLDSVIVSVGTASRVRLSAYNSALTNAVGAWFNKKIGGANGAGLISQENGAVLLGTTYLTVELAANTPYEFTLPFPFQLAEGTGVIVQADVQNITLAANFQGREFTP